MLSPAAAAAGDGPVAADGSSLLLLSNGRVIVGRVSQNAGGFLVESRNGSVLIPFNRVRLRAADRQDAYRRLLSTFPNPSPETHVGLARWCMTQQLYDETKTELRSALKSNPDYDEARNMLRRLEVILDPPSANQPVDHENTRQTGDGFKPPPASSLAALPGEAASDFVTRVQPLLMNNCALAGCHNSHSPSRFQLARVRIGRYSSRLLTERNLAAALRYVDPRDPDGSPLLRVPRGNHGRGGRAIFNGPEGDGQLQLLRQWTRQAASQAGAPIGDSMAAGGRANRFRNDPPGRAARSKAAAARPASGPAGDANHSEVGGYSRPTPAGEKARMTTSSGQSALDDPLLEAIVREQQHDAFSPAEFNRRTKPLR